MARGRAAGLTLVGAGSDDWTPEQWRERVEESFADANSQADADGKRELKRIRAEHQLPPAGRHAPRAQLAGLLAQLEGPVAVYFALPPRISQLACEALSPEQVPAGTRLVMEKPFGSGEESARHLNKTLAALVPEDHIHRVDHFLGKATVLNILGLRFANRFLEPVWNREHIAKVEIIFDEDLALEGRARYYDGAGALRDMIQSHLLQVMALLAMEPPASLDERDLRDAVATRAARQQHQRRPYAKSTRRARYTAGTIGGRKVPDYAKEDGVDPASSTETLAEVEVEIDNWRWAGVPFILRSGKALGHRRKEAVVTFRPVAAPAHGVHRGGLAQPAAHRLRPGHAASSTSTSTARRRPHAWTGSRCRPELSASELLPYGEVLDGVLTGDPLLSVRGDTAEECWRIVEPVLKAWARGQRPAAGVPGREPGARRTGRRSASRRRSFRRTARTRKAGRITSRRR